MTAAGRFAMPEAERPLTRRDKQRKVDLLHVADALGAPKTSPLRTRRQRAFRRLREFERRDGVWYMTRDLSNRGRSGKFWAREEALDLLRPPDPTRGDRLRADIDKLIEVVRDLRRDRRRDAARIKDLEQWRKRAVDLLAHVSAISAE